MHRSIITFINNPYQYFKSEFLYEFCQDCYYFACMRAVRYCITDSHFNLR